MENLLGIDKVMTEEEIQRKAFIESMLAEKPELEGLYSSELNELNTKESRQDPNTDLMPSGESATATSEEVEKLRAIKSLRQNDPNSYINDTKSQGELPEDPERDAKLAALDDLKQKYRGK